MGLGTAPLGAIPLGAASGGGVTITEAVSLNGYEIRLTFSEAVDKSDPTLYLAPSYFLVPLVGAAPVTILSVYSDSVIATTDSVILVHTGTTLGGSYQVGSMGPVSGSLALLTLGDAPSYTVTAIDGDELVLNFSENMYSNSDLTDIASYEFTSDPVYPISLDPVAITYPYSGDYSKIHMTVSGMTTLQYTCNVAPALAFDYDASVLPDADLNLLGVEINSGSGLSVVNSGNLLLSKNMLDTYGWEFLDISGRVVPDLTTFKASVSINAANATYNPPLASFPDLTVAYFIFEDGPAATGVRVKISLKQVLGTDYIQIESGTYDNTIQQNWSTGAIELSLVRNIKAGIYSILLDGYPILSELIAVFDGLSEGTDAGVSCVLAPDDFNVFDFLISEVKFTATSTVYSASWNFLHGVLSPSFTGSGVLTRDYILTKRGPLTKGWGDATPATKQDVEVLVSGTAVEIDTVNPYLGRIQLTHPVPLLPVGVADVKVSYYWMASPIMEMVGLNTPGLVLNQCVRQTGHTSPPAHGQDSGSPLHINPEPNRYPPLADDKVAVRFPMTSVIGPVTRPKPLQIGHRYIGFNRDYSALLNDPTSLLLNQNPNANSVDTFTRSMDGLSAVYDGINKPIESVPNWTLDGLDSGHVNAGLGIYTLVDDRASEFEPDDRTVAMYSNLVDLTYPASATLAARLIIKNYVVDGVFTGVGFGIHDNNYLYQIGFLDINEVKHLGFLINPEKQELQESWDLGPKAYSTILSNNTFSISTSDMPVGFLVGMRFQIFEHAQAGVYTVTAIEAQCDGTTTITIDGEFPAEWNLYEQRNPYIIFEIQWDTYASTYQLIIDLDSKKSVLSISGKLSTTMQYGGSTDSWPIPSDSALVLNTDEKGQVFWGSLSYLASNTTDWSFFRYGIVSDLSVQNAPAIIVATEMDVLPPDNSDPWFTSQSFGVGRIDTNTLTLKSLVASDTLDYVFEYSRIEPFLTDGVGIDVRAEFKLDSGILGAGDADIVIRNGSREVRLATILYAEGYSGLEYRRLVNIPFVSMAGIQDPTQQNWTLVSGSDGSVKRQEYDLIITQTSNDTFRYQSTLDVSGFIQDSGYRIAESQLEVDSYTTDSSDLTGVIFQACIGPNRWFGLRPKGGSTPKIQLLDTNDNVIHEYNFDWADGLHTYRVVGASGVLSVFIDDILMLPTLNIDLFIGGAADTVIFGATNAIGNVSSVVRWKSISYHATPNSHCIRTLGLWKGGDKDSIDSWELPRTDATSAKNSEQVGPVIQEMDWTQDQEVRLLLQADWGVTLYRPDIALPPYYQAESTVAGTGFANQTNEPSAGWINIEYPQLPYHQSDFGSVSFGSLDSRSITQQHWNWVRYRIFKALTNDFIAPQHMVLNQFDIVTSGELNKDRTLESMIILTLDNRRVSLKPAHVYASDIYKIVDGDTIYTRYDWEFDSESQLVTLGLDSSYNELHFSGDHVPVTVIFKPGKPVTNTYLEQQALVDSVTKLNSGTPPIPLSKTNSIEKRITTKGLLDDPYHVIPDTLNDPYQVLDHEADADALYTSMEFIDVTNGGMDNLITIAGEGTLPEGFSGYSSTEEKAIGASVFDFSGTSFWNKCEFPKPNPFSQNGCYPTQVLFCSGGDYVQAQANPVIGDPTTWLPGLQQPLGGTLGPGSAVLYPNNPSPGAINRSTTWYFRIGSISSGSTATNTPYTEDFDGIITDAQYTYTLTPVP